MKSYGFTLNEEIFHIEVGGWVEGPNGGDSVGYPIIRILSHDWMVFTSTPQPTGMYSSASDQFATEAISVLMSQDIQEYL